jgi:hypothetical protein
MAPRRAYKFDEQRERGDEARRVLQQVYSQQEGYLVVDGTEHHDRKQGVDSILIKRLDVNRIYKVDWKLDQGVAKSGRLTIEAVSQRFGGRVESRNGISRAIGGRVVKLGWARTSQADLVVSYSPWESRAYELSMAAIQEKWDTIERFSLEAVETRDARGGWITENYYVPKDWLSLHQILLRQCDTRPAWKLRPFPLGTATVLARVRGEEPERAKHWAPYTWVIPCWECDGTGNCDCISCEGKCCVCLQTGRLVDYDYVEPPGEIPEGTVRFPPNPYLQAFFETEEGQRIRRKLGGK